MLWLILTAERFGNASNESRLVRQILLGSLICTKDSMLSFFGFRSISRHFLLISTSDSVVQTVRSELFRDRLANGFVSSTFNVEHYAEIELKWTVPSMKIWRGICELKIPNQIINTVHWTVTSQIVTLQSLSGLWRKLTIIKPLPATADGLQRPFCRGWSIESLRFHLW